MTPVDQSKHDEVLRLVFLCTTWAVSSAVQIGLSAPLYSRLLIPLLSSVTAAIVLSAFGSALACRRRALKESRL